MIDFGGVEVLDHPYMIDFGGVEVLDHPNDDYDVINEDFHRFEIDYKGSNMFNLLQII